MTQKEHRTIMEIFFKGLEKSRSYYWEYRDRLYEFKLINELSYSQGLITKKIYNKTLDFIDTELKRYA